MENNNNEFMKFSKKIVLFKIKYGFLVFLLLLINFCFINISLAQDTGLGTAHTPLQSQTDAFIGMTGFGAITAETSVGGIVASVIQAFLGLLGIIFIILMVTAGYKWMTAGGDEEKLTQAKSMISRAIYGLIVTVSAYAITYFVFTNLPGGEGGPPIPE